MDTSSIQALERGFSTALMIPAMASTLRQAQREAAKELHILADCYRSAQQNAAVPPDDKVRAAASRFGQILVEQGINGSVFFLAVKLAVVLAGPTGGMLVQLGITGNTIITPEQTQKFNPSELLFSRIGACPDWVGHLPEPALRGFIDLSGRFADICGYGRLRDRSSANRRGADAVPMIQFQRQPASRVPSRSPGLPRGTGPIFFRPA